jgi:hypothetical protein
VLFFTINLSFQITLEELLYRAAKRALKSTLYMWREPIVSNATHTRLYAFPTTPLCMEDDSCEEYTNTSAKGAAAWCMGHLLGFRLYE